MSETVNQEAVSSPMPQDVQNFVVTNLGKIAKFLSQIYDTANPTTSKGRDKTVNMCYTATGSLRAISSFLTGVYPQNGDVTPEIIEEMTKITEDITTRMSKYSKSKFSKGWGYTSTTARNRLAETYREVRDFSESGNCCESREVLLKKLEAFVTWIYAFNDAEDFEYICKKDNESMYRNLRKNRSPWG